MADALYAASQIDEAVTHWEKLVESDPANPRYRRELAQTYNSIAIRYDKNRLAEKQEMHEKALAIREALAKEFPDDPETHAHLGMTLNNMGFLLSLENHLEQSLAMYRRGVEHKRIAYEQAPQVVPYGRLLALGYTNIATTERKLERHADAVAASSKALDIWMRLTGENPALPHLQTHLRNAYSHLAGYQRAAGRHDEADHSIREARNLLEKLPIQSSEDFYDLARYRARCAEIGIGARLPGTPPTTPSMRVRTRRFISLEQAYSRCPID